MTRLVHALRVAYVANKFLVIDGHSMAFRAFFALPADRFTVAGGQHTNAVYGFLSMLAKMLETEKPTHLAVAFDASRDSFRTELYSEYKGGRDATPPEFEGQVELIGAVLDALGVPTVTMPEFEADDVLATWAKQGRDEGFEVMVASGDRDTFQLVNDQVTVIYPGRSTSDLTHMTPEVVQERYGVPPSQYPELAAIVGESADNLPGVPGVGPKTAAQWIAKFGSLEELLNNADQIGGKRGEALRDHVADIERNRMLNRLLTDLDVAIKPAECIPSSPDRSALESLFDTLEFTGLRARIYKSMAPLWNEDAEAPRRVGDAQSRSSDGAVHEDPAGTTQSEPSTILVTAESNIEQILQNLIGSKAVSSYVALWGTGRLAPTSPDLTALALASLEATVVLDPAELTDQQHRAIKKFLADNQKLVVHGGKALEHGLRSQGWEIPLPDFDTQLAAYIARPGQRTYDLDKVSSLYLDREPVQSDDGALLSLGEFSRGSGTGISPAQESLASCARTVFDLREPLNAELIGQQEASLLEDLEIPISRVLGHMEDLGIAIDVQKLESLRSEFSAEVHQAAQDAFKAVGHETNLGSPKQLQVVLFDELGMPKTRKTKTGWTTDAEALQDLFAKTQHPFLEALLRHRDRTKLLQMIDGLLAEVQPDGRIHTTFQQTVAATGRLASSDPNLQNIPARTEAGLRIREAFVAGPEFEDLMSVDYSQLEMRIMAHLSNDPDLIAAFRSGEDLHRTMAALVFGLPVDEITSELRNRIKATSYGLAYGLSPFGLSRQLGTSVEEARELHTKYFERFGGIGRFLQEIVEEARTTGYTETILGRRRYFPELNSSVRRVADMAERAALNAPIQGSAADIMKLAMLDVDRNLRDGGYKSRMLLQVHDELLLEIAPGETKVVEDLVRAAMGESVKMSVPLDVAVGVGWSWRDAAH